MVKLSDFIEKYIKVEPYCPNQQDAKSFSRNPSEFILRRLLSRQFRKKQLPDNVAQNLLNKVQQSVKSGLPIHVVVPFGGYKHFWNQSHPSPDWAEVFHLSYMAEFLGPILNMYEPGVRLEYVSEDLILTRMNNYPEASLDVYAKGFRSILSALEGLFPKNLTIEFVRLKDRFDLNRLHSLVDVEFQKQKTRWDSISAKERAVELKRSVRSIFWRGERDLGSLSEAQKDQFVVDSRLCELAFYTVEAMPEFIGDYYIRGENICICFSFGLSPDNVDSFLTIGSCHNSMVDFWIGTGALRLTGNKELQPTIISRNQYEAAGRGNNMILDEAFARIESFKVIPVFG